MSLKWQAPTAPEMRSVAKSLETIPGAFCLVVLTSAFCMTAMWSWWDAYIPRHRLLAYLWPRIPGTFFSTYVLYGKCVLSCNCHAICLLQLWTYCTHTLSQHTQKRIILNLVLSPFSCMHMVFICIQARQVIGQVTECSVLPHNKTSGWWWL